MKWIVLLRMRKCTDFSWHSPLTPTFDPPKKIVQIVLKIGWSFKGCSNLQQTTKTYIQPHFKVMMAAVPLQSFTLTTDHRYTVVPPPLFPQSHCAGMPQHLGLLPICPSPITFTFWRFPGFMLGKEDFALLQFAQHCRRFLLCKPH